MSVLSLFVFETIGGWGLNKDSVLKKLAKNPGAEKVQVFVSSYGGAINDAIMIYEALVAYPAPVEVFYMSTSASAALVIGSAADAGGRFCTPRSTLMTHAAMLNLYGAYYGEDLRNMAAVSEKYTTVVAESLARTSGVSAEEWITRLGKETYYSASEAVAAGLVDQVVDSVPMDFASYAAELEESENEYDSWFYWFDMLQNNGGDVAKTLEKAFQIFNNQTTKDVNVLQKLVGLITAMGFGLTFENKAVTAEEAGTKLAQLENKFAEQAREIVNEVAGEAVKNQQTELAEIRKQLGEVVNAMKTDVQEKGQKIADLETVKTENEQAIADLKNQIAELQNAVTGIKAKVPGAPAGADRGVSANAETQPEKKPVGAGLSERMLKTGAVNQTDIDKIMKLVKADK